MDIEYSDYEKYENHKRVLDVIRHYKMKGRITEDWMEDQKGFILQLREFFGNMEMMNLDCDDKKFRGMAEECELILNHLVEEIRETKTFTVDIYYRLNLNMQTMLEIKFGDDELCELMGGL